MNDREKRTLSLMIRLYCRKKHGISSPESLYLSNDTGGTESLYVMNHPIDCLAFRQLNPEMENVRFAATGGISTLWQILPFGEGNTRTTTSISSLNGF